MCNLHFLSFPAPSSLFNSEANSSNLTTNVGKSVAEACREPLRPLCIQIVLSKTSLSPFPSLPLSVCVPYSLLPALCSYCRITLNIALTFSQSITRRERLKIMLIAAGWLGQKTRGRLFIHIFYSLLRMRLKDLPISSSHASMPLAVTRGVH